MNGYDTVMRSFVNIIETPGGGTHVDGLMNSVTRQIRKAVEANARKLKVNLKDSNMKVERDDIMAGLVAVVTVRNRSSRGRRRMCSAPRRSSRLSRA